MAGSTGFEPATSGLTVRSHALAIGPHETSSIGFRVVPLPSFPGSASHASPCTLMGQDKIETSDCGPADHLGRRSWGYEGKSGAQTNQYNPNPAKDERDLRGCDFARLWAASVPLLHSSFIVGRISSQQSVLGRNTGNHTPLDCTES